MSLATEIAGKLNYLNTQDKSTINALAPYSGYMAWQKDNFVFNTSSSFLASIADKNRYLKFGDKVVDTYGPELVTNGDFSDGTTGFTVIGNTSPQIVEVVDGSLHIKTDGSACGVSFTLPVNKMLMVEISYMAISGSLKFDAGEDIVLNETKKYNFTYITSQSTAYLYRNSGSGEGYIDNISVREIQTKSALDYIPEVYVQDQTANGLTTQQSVNAGDYVVVDRKELVTNGTFDSDISGWTAVNAVISLENNGIKVDDSANSGGFSSARTNISVVSGVKYQFKYSSQSGTGDTEILLYSGANSVSVSDGNLIPYTATSHTGTGGSYTYEWVSTYTGIATLSLGVSGTNYVIYDNISVKQLDEVYRAKTDAPSGTLLTNTTYFEVRDNLPISNQIAFLHTMDATTKAYEGITNEILFNDALAIETPKAIMLKNGFSEVSKGLYSKGSKWYIFSGYWQTLNNGAYHPVWNMAGTKSHREDLDQVASRPWYVSGVKQATKISEAFSTSITTSTTYGTGSILTSGTETINSIVYGRGACTYDDIASKVVLTRPDGKFYDIIYPDQFISFESSELAYKPTELEMKEIREYEKFRGVEGLVFTEEKLQTTIGSVATLEVNDGTKYVVNQYIQVYGDSTPYRKRIESISGNTLTLDSVFSTSKTASNYIIGGGSIPFNSKETSLTTDLIGSPSNYPTILKDRLAEGKGAFGINPLLVGQDGTSYIPSGITLNPIISNKVLSFLYSTGIIYSDNSGVTYKNLINRTISYIDNIINVGGAVGTISIVSYTSQNNPYQATTPKVVLTVEPKVIASNSHSLYKGAITSNCIGKIQVGNGSNGYESKVLENSEIHNGYYTNDDSQTNVTVNTLSVIKCTGINPKGIEGHYYQPKNAFTTNLSTVDLSYVVNFDDITITTPTHSTIALDDANSPASKWFEGLCYDDDYVYPYAIIEELAYNTGTSSYDGDDDKFTQLTNGTLIDLNGNTVKTMFAIGSPIGRRG